MQHTGIILAGGKSSRMGTEKGLVLLHEKPLILYAIDTLKQITDSIIIIANNPIYNQFGYPVYKDMISDTGPIGGIYTGLQKSASDSSIVLSCDMPFIPTQLIQLILSKNQQVDCIVPMFKNQLEPLCAWYSKSILPLIESQIAQQNYALQHLLKLANTCVVDPSNELTNFNDEWFTNINYQSDLILHANK